MYKKILNPLSIDGRTALIENNCIIKTPLLLYILLLLKIQHNYNIYTITIES
jgi:hypothetical protein